MRRIISKGQLFLLIVCAAILIYGYMQIAAVPVYLQYMMPSPSVQTENEEKPNQNLVSYAERLQEAAEEWSGFVRHYSMDGIVQQATLTGEGAVQARLTALGPDGQVLKSLIPRFGRLMYPEELKDGEKVILIDENLALQLFRVAEAVEHTVFIGEDAYRVIGVIRHGRKVGDTVDYCAYIPLSSVTASRLQMDALCVTADPIPGTGASVAVQSTLNNLFPGGTFIDLQKERMGAWLWLRVLLFLLGMACMVRAAMYLKNATVLFVRRYRMRLRDRYAWQLTGWMIWHVLLLALGFAACAAAFVYLMNLILAPVYIFPEWIPAILVEWDDIQSAFWKVWKNFAAMKEYRSPELMRLRFFTILMNGFSALAGVLLFMAFGRIRSSMETVRLSLHAMKALGCSETFVRTERVVEMEELGYIQMNGEWPAQGKRLPKQVQMLRILSPERVLCAVPASRKTGSFVLEVTDPLIQDNNLRLEVVCDGEKNTIREVNQDWDIQMSVSTLARVLYGSQSLQAFLDSQTGCEMHMRNEAMDGFFSGHLHPGMESV